jgi:hypothetical protein
MGASYAMDMLEAKVMGIGDFRKALAERIEAAAFDKEPTVIKHGKRDAARAALVPYDVGSEPIPIGLAGGETHLYVVSAEWMAQNVAASAKTA